jgi:uroporphyrinogen-III synthase
MPQANFNNLCVLALESRRAQEISKLIANNGGRPLVVPSVRELPLESNTEALDFARKLDEGAFDMVIFMTGVGVRLLTRIVERVYPSEKFAELLRSVTVVARGPKPIAALREMGVTANLTVPEPNTWHDLLAVLDERQQDFPLMGRHIGLQEYGVRNSELVAALEQRGAEVTSVPIYEWALPEDTRPLEKAIAAIVRGEVSVVLVTSSIQVKHLFDVAEKMGSAGALRNALTRTIVASIGPLTSEEIRRRGLVVDMESAHPKMGFLVQEADQRSSTLLKRKSGLAS